MRRTGWIAHCVLWPSAETAISPRSMRACLDCACRRARRSERIAARYGRKRLPSRWKEDAVRAALAEERGGANASRQDMGGKENCLRKWKAGTGRAALAEVRGGLDVSRQDTEGKENSLRSGRRTPVGVGLPKSAAKKSYRRLAAVARLAFLRLFVAAGGSAVGAEPLFAFRAVVAQHGPAYRTATQRACVRGAMAHGAFHHRHSKHPFAKTSPARMARKISRAFALRVCSAKGYFMRHGSF